MGFRLFQPRSTVFTVLAWSLGFMALLVLTPLTISAQGSGQHFVLEGGIWFLEADGQRFKVDPDVVSVKFRSGVASDEKIEFYAEETTQVVRENRLGIIDLQVPSGKSPIDFVRDLEATGLFEFAEVNTFGEYIKFPNDPMFTNLYGLHNTGQTGGTSDADIDAPEAWDTTTGNPAVIVAVADSGTDIDHEDLGCNIWVNPGEDLDGDGVVWDPDDMNGVDDDGNGRVDDLVGWDFGNGNNDPRGSFYHGTHVAGIVGACGNNGVGVIGVAGGFSPSPGAKLMPLGVGDSGPIGSVLDDAIIYAADMGARVITMSLTVGPSSAINAAIDYAHDTVGVFLNNASGNDNSVVTYPATHPDVVAVGATDHNDNRASFSNHGPELEVVAPGVNIWSTRIGDTYGVGSGTSYASPYVAGTAALMFSANPGATNEEVRQCLLQTAEDQVGNPAEDTPGRDNFYGFGRINARDALACIGGASAGQVYDVWVSASFNPPGTSFPDCFRFGASTLNIDGCFDPTPGDMIEIPLVGDLIWWLGVVPCQGLNLIFLGTTLDGSTIGAVDVIGGSGVGQTESTTFGVEGVENPDCTLTVLEKGRNPYSRK